MTQILGHDEQKCLQFTDATIKEAYKHVVLLANSKYKEPIKTLKSRHHGYEKEDFIQETMQIILKESTRKTFPTINHLKSFINFTMEYHYLKEKRKYFYTKQRGSFTEVSMYEPVVKTDAGCSQVLAEILTYDKDEVQHLSEKIDLKQLTKRNLYIVYDWKQLLKVCELSELKNYKYGYALSVNYFVKTLEAFGELGTCRHFKENGFFMTKRILNEFSQVLIDYIKNNSILEIEDDFPRYKNITRPKNIYFEFISNAQSTCTCGYHYNEDLSNEEHWQCPQCGKIHDKKQLIKLRSKELELC